MRQADPSKARNPLRIRRFGTSTWLCFNTEHNTLTSELLEALGTTAKTILDEPGVSILIITGQGSRFFSPGFHLKEVAGFDRSQMRKHVSSYLQVCRCLYFSEKPTIALLNGDALAGGFLLASLVNTGFLWDRFTLAFLNSPGLFRSRIQITNYSQDLLAERTCRSCSGLDQFLLLSHAPLAGSTQSSTSGDDLSRINCEISSTIQRLEPKRSLDRLFNNIDVETEEFLNAWFQEKTGLALDSAIRRTR